MSVDFVLIVGIVAEGVKNLGKLQVREPFRYLLRRDPESPDLHDSADRRARVPDNRLAAKYLIVFNYIAMIRGVYQLKPLG
jgi:hypothetical protein